MTGATLLRAALDSGDYSDETIAAALDAIREECASSLLEAISEVYGRYRVKVATESVAVATKLLAKGSPVRHRLMDVVESELLCYEWDTIRIFVLPDNWPPHWLGLPERNEKGVLVRAVGVGAQWIVDQTTTLETTAPVEAWLADVLYAKPDVVKEAVKETKWPT